MTDGPHGVRKEIEGTQYDEAEPATCFPTASCLASSWDADLVGELARALAEESIQKGVDILLGPGVTMKRTPLCGRNFEYFSEDPYLTGILATSYVKELQAMGVGASLKHFAVNNQESNRQTANAQVDERALREIYLRAFEMVVKAAQPATIMSSYNRLNGRYVGESAWLLTDILRKEWGFQGLVVSDWSAIIHLDEAIRAGHLPDVPQPPAGGPPGPDDDPWRHHRPHRCRRLPKREPGHLPPGLP
ncbi:MAG: glycoside hydrolase family 3 N-terminal domain-containing protein, partial [Firmicutes bacterium]|nr:glycoside hydrolase family 3 N-terminal domain-containing protein [Bacillota bacterium]